jgi:exopolysaccharide biosynthesis polyprenyl glycosylphosphotransferase
MLRRQRQIRIQLHKIVDAGLFALSFWLAHFIRSELLIERLWRGEEIGGFHDYVIFLLIIILISPIILATQGFYNRTLLTSRKQTAIQLFRACALATVFLILLVFLFRLQVGQAFVFRLQVEQSLARSVFILFGGISFVLVSIKEELAALATRIGIGHSQAKHRLILAGAKQDTAKLRERFANWRGKDFEIITELDLNHTSIEQLVDLLHEHSINGVVLSSKHILFGQIEKAIQACELEGVEAWLMTDFFNTQISRTSIDDFCGKPMLVFQSTPEASWQAMAKDVVDKVGAFFLLLVLTPMVLVPVALVIKLTSPGPILFRQKRSGLNGRPFTLYKFRSMVTDAEQLKGELEALNEMAGPVFKVSDDPRITPVGRFIRKFSIDEFPQLFNVLRGEMSLVGPRPLPVDEVKRFDDLAHRRRLSVKPGLTCLWQISGRNNVTDFQEWVRLDLEYIDHWSFWLDVKIILRTIPVVLLGTGAK